MSDESETCGGGACSLNQETTSKKNTPASSSINETSEYRKSLLQAVPEEASMTPPNFQIPESNASDIAPSECSSYYRKEWPSNQLTKTEALSGSQHVVLWLTRTSMSDLPSVPSLKNLVQASVFGSNSVKIKPHKGSSSEKNSSIQRNFSTKSFLKYEREDDHAEPPLRKCETVIALSAMSSSSSTTSQKKAKKQPSSPLNVFKHLSNKVTKSSENGSTTQGVTCESPYPGMIPRNRMRSTTSSMICSRCTSVLSVNQYSRATSRCTSQISLHHLPSFNRKSSCKSTAEESPVFCKICLVEYHPRETHKIWQCNCLFCQECLKQYLGFEIMAGAYEISCPDSQCEKESIFQLEEIEKIVGKDLTEKHKTFRLNTEVALDSNRAWCPKPGCNTICHICASATNLTKSSAHSVNCPKCEKEFCSSCSGNWHPGMTCQDYGKMLVKNHGPGAEQDTLLIIEGDIKRCPMCQVPIERDAGCAQMMCKRCKHVFCWFCLTSLDDDFLLRHYDSGECKGKLGHTRASLLWHRAQVIGIFAGFVVLLLVASPLLLIAAPCIFCCRCKSCQELEEEFEAANSPTKTSRSNSGGIAIQIMKD
eukprot:09688.XXX_96590_93889_1 [CDS] Oithona nana genome sequencing.